MTKLDHDGGRSPRCTHQDRMRQLVRLVQLIFDVARCVEPGGTDLRPDTDGNAGMIYRDIAPGFSKRKRPFILERNQDRHA